MVRTALAGGFRTSLVDRNRNLENTPNMSFGSNGVDWVRSFRKDQQEFFRFHRARTALRGGFRTSFVDRNRNCKNTPNMSFGSNGVDWVRSFQKNQHEFFRFNRARTALGGGFRTSFVDQNRNSENTPNLSFGSYGVDWVRPFRKNSTPSFMLQPRSELPSGAGFARVLLTKTETSQTHQT